MLLFQYKLNKNLINREAASLVFLLNELPISIYLNKSNEDRKINGKSLIGVLSGHFSKGDTINIMIDNSEYQSKLKEILNNY